MNKLIPVSRKIEEGSLISRKHGHSTFKKGEKLTQDEIQSFSRGQCPDCLQRNTINEGPSGGGSINCICVQCGSRFNDMGPLGVERISDAMQRYRDRISPAR